MQYMIGKNNSGTFHLVKPDAEKSACGLAPREGLDIGGWADAWDRDSSNPQDDGNQDACGRCSAIWNPVEDGLTEVGASDAGNIGHGVTTNGEAESNVEARGFHVTELPISLIVKPGTTDAPERVEGFLSDLLQDNEIIGYEWADATEHVVDLRVHRESAPA